MDVRIEKISDHNFSDNELYRITYSEEMPDGTTFEINDIFTEPSERILEVLEQNYRCAEVVFSERRAQLLRDSGTIEIKDHYLDLLKKYVRWVVDCESIDYVNQEGSSFDPYPRIFADKEEYEEMKRIAAEAVAGFTRGGRKAEEPPAISVVVPATVSSITFPVLVGDDYYRDLLKKYMSLVVSIEGVNFIENLVRDLDILDESDYLELERLSEERTKEQEGIGYCILEIPVLIKALFLVDQDPEHLSFATVRFYLEFEDGTESESVEVSGRISNGVVHKLTFKSRTGGEVRGIRVETECGTACNVHPGLPRGSAYYADMFPIRHVRRAS